MRRLRVRDDSIPITYISKFQWIQSFVDPLFVYRGTDMCRKHVIRAFPAAGFAILEKQELDTCRALILSELASLLRIRSPEIRSDKSGLISFRKILLSSV